MTSSGTGSDTGDPFDSLSTLDPKTLPAGSEPCREPVLMEVEYLIDGDTIIVSPRDGGADENVRFIGIDTPELAFDSEPAECGAKDASNYVDEMLMGGLVWLTFDTECVDSYDRTLAYLHLGMDDEDFVNRRQVADGYAEAFSVSPNTSFSSEFLGLEQQARELGLGIWAECL